MHACCAEASPEAGKGMDARKLCIHNVPSVTSDDRMHDKLLIHFLRPRNGGGEVLELKYPTEEAGMAFVTFEEREVADRILGRQHRLELDGKSYVLDVRRAERPRTQGMEAYMLMRTTLDLRWFQDKDGVKELVRKHGFRVLSETGARTEIEGAFPALKKLRSELLYLANSSSRMHFSSPMIYGHQVTENHSTAHHEGSLCRRKEPTWTGRTPERSVDNVFESGHSVARKMGRMQLDSLQNEPPRSRASRRSTEPLPTHVRGNPMKAFPEAKYSSGDAATSVSGSGLGSVSLTGTADWQDNLQRLQNGKGPRKRSGDSYSLPSPSSTKYSAGSSRSLTPKTDPGSSSPGFSRCFIADRDTLKYLQTFNKHGIDKILDSLSVEMNSENQGDICNITLTSHSFSSTFVEIAVKNFSDLLASNQMYLRTYDIPLCRFQLEKQLDIIKRSKMMGEIYHTLITVHKDNLHLIGPSREVYEVYQNLIGEAPADLGCLQREDTIQHLLKTKFRRDSSCPPVEKKTRDVPEHRPHDSLKYSLGSHARFEHEELPKKVHQQAPNTDTPSKGRLKRAASEGRGGKKGALGPADVSPAARQERHLPQTRPVGERGRSSARNSMQDLSFLNKKLIKEKWSK
ncbi:uncharacterized protein LOC115083988 [Rhinatrema bivittatum]|uniref:uncharacterized protein LOC115083988 n=1 Tax=Rhinatrema bivittatum TaxID=194408 RepID=UPI0011290DEE|nr:uncharacterized protein LOC115083988 [Rhinatrema bivittatum]XP_029444062.1 uncharacterized protein LOC115083988 [Rhinatrema bivittatum]XP_029444063.1 uncharacterized protein LOC115083988 [Rhinatrema bivittatum]XP_029444064.1 uncharacterized protein LOC115083988 [Rhinatrema bivittatum]XP_029444065.1 uncharacterized protein LOC115083988 [Rhinatrema bivittatum]